MSVQFVVGDALNQGAELVVHQANCIGAMGAGIAKQIRAEYPHVYSRYHNLCSCSNPYQLLGHIQVIDCICNLFGQLSIGTHRIQTDYNAVTQAFRELAVYCSNHHIQSIALPYHMGCGLAGGNWDRYLAIIRQFDALCKDLHNPVTITICRY